MPFKGAEAELQEAIQQDDGAAVEAALSAGADPNARGVGGTTPLQYAAGTMNKRAMDALLRHGADPHVRDDDGQNAVTLAATVWHRDPGVLRMLIQAGADPNTRRADGDPVIQRFMNDADLDAIRYMASVGADLNIRNRSGRPLVVAAGIAEEWDVLWVLLDLGADHDYAGEPFTLQDAFATPEVTPPDSPLWPYKEKVWHALNNRGMVLPPLAIHPPVTDHP